MASFRCKMCGAPLEGANDKSVVTCAYCGAKQTVSAGGDSGNRGELFNRANAFRQACDFDKALIAYESLIAAYPKDAEAHWGAVISRYGIEYVDDPATGGKKPTIHRVSYTSILKDKDYLLALENADVIAKEQYQVEANQIAQIQQNILSISSQEGPFDIFICYKETDSVGRRSQDSVLSQEIYGELVKRGYKVFFARVTLESKLGTLYEPFIFSALQSAKIMLVVGTSKENLESTWVQNEWSRFLALMAKTPSKTIIPCYKGMDAYQLPEKLLNFQAQDMSKLGFMQDLLHGIDKIMGRAQVPPAMQGFGVYGAPTTQVAMGMPAAPAANVSTMLTRAEILISDGDYRRAKELLEKVLDASPTCSRAYLLKLVMDMRMRSVEDLRTVDRPLDGNRNYEKAYQFGNPEERRFLDEVNQSVKSRISQNEAKRVQDAKESAYLAGLRYKQAGNYAAAVAQFKRVPGYKDADDMVRECQAQQQDAKRDAIYRSCVLPNPEAQPITKLKGMVAKLDTISGFTPADNLKLRYMEIIAEQERKSANAAAGVKPTKPTVIKPMKPTVIKPPKDAAPRDPIEVEQRRKKRKKVVKRVVIFSVLGTVAVVGVVVVNSVIQAQQEAERWSSYWNQSSSYAYSSYSYYSPSSSSSKSSSSSSKSTGSASSVPKLETTKLTQYKAAGETYASKFTYGYYPQAVAATSKVSLKANGTYYREVGDGSVYYLNGGYYYIDDKHTDVYEYSPVMWKVFFAEESMGAWAISESILDRSAFNNALSMDYTYYASTIRAFLETTMYQRMFVEDAGTRGDWALAIFDSEPDPDCAYPSDKTVKTKISLPYDAFFEDAEFNMNTQAKRVTSPTDFADEMHRKDSSKYTIDEYWTKTASYRATDDWWGYCYRKADGSDYNGMAGIAVDIGVRPIIVLRSDLYFK